jgi:hypothetical protein
VNRRSRFFRSGLIPGVAALVTGVAFFAVPSQAAHADGGGCDCYVVTPATNPATAGAGTGEVYAFQVTNNDPNETLRNLTFTAPADFVITAASGPSGTSVSALPGSSVGLKLPSEPTGSTFTVDVTALAPCVAASSEVWEVSGVDSLGETNEVRWSSSPLAVSVTGECSLAFTGQPAQTAAKSNILTGFNSTGSPIAVQLRDADNAPLNPADYSAGRTQVKVSIQANPGGGTLAGTTTVTSSNGVANFGNLQINKAGVGYDLAASATGFTPATSALFTISGQIQACATGSCTASQSTSTTAASVAASSASGDFVALGLGGVSFSCAHYKAVSDVAAFGVLTSSGASVTGAPAIGILTVPKSVVKSAHRPLFRWQLCYASRTPFPAIPGTSGTTIIGGDTYYTGLLLSCFLFGPGHPEPCLKSRHRTWAGAVTLTFVALGDPYFHD